MRDDRIRWEQRYRDPGRQALGKPSAFLRSHRNLIPAGAVLDVAAGDGRNALYLARHGHPVHAVDIAFSALSQLATTARQEQLPVGVVQADLDELPLPPSYYAAVVNIRYLQRGCFGRLKEALRPGGVIIVETFLIDQREIGPPTNPDHLLEHGELLELLSDFEVLVSEEGRFESEGGAGFLARAVARRPAPHR